jgi:hypothetical protein
MLKSNDGSTVMANEARTSRSRKITSSLLHEEHEYNTDDDELSGPPWHLVTISFYGKHCQVNAGRNCRPFF